MNFGTFYRPPDTEIEDLKKIECALSRIGIILESGNIILVRDFNLGNINWEISAFVSNSKDAALQTALLNIIADFSLSPSYTQIQLQVGVFWICSSQTI